MRVHLLALLLVLSAPGTASAFVLAEGPPAPQAAYDSGECAEIVVEPKEHQPPPPHPHEPPPPAQRYTKVTVYTNLDKCLGPLVAACHVAGVPCCGMVLVVDPCLPSSLWQGAPPLEQSVGLQPIPIADTGRETPGLCVTLGPPDYVSAQDHACIDGGSLL